MDKDSFGEHLKREREMRGVSLDEISSATRIATKFLEAIENEQWELLPGGVFNRGFVRAVAHYLGLDEEAIMAEFGLAAGQRPSVPVWTGSPPAVRADKPWLAWAVAAIVVIVVVAGGWFGTRRILAWRATRHATVNTVITPSADPSPATSPTASPNTIATGDSSTPATAIPSADTSTATRAPNGNPATGTALAETPVPLPKGVPPAGETSNAPGAPNSPGVPKAATKPDALATSNFDGNLVLKIETGKTTKVTVETDAHRVFNGTIKPGDGHRFSAREKIQISAGDAGALMLELNGQTLAPMGPDGHKGKITLTRATLKANPGGAN
jgi:cytoskeleton protein RodZ